MIKSFTPRPYDGFHPLPSYATNVRTYLLTGTVVIAGRQPYEITLAILSIGESVSAGNPLTHAAFESFDSHGERMATTRSRVGGHDREFSAVKNAMIDAGVEFAPVTICESEKFLEALGAWFCGQNPDLKKYRVLSQTRH